MKTQRPFLRRLIVWTLTAGFAVALPFLLIKGLLWIAGGAVLFSLARLTLLEVKRKTILKDLLAVAAGIGAATVLLPVSLPAAFAAFFLVQLIYELGFMETRSGFTADRFQDSYKTAERILKSIP